jgi:alkanesulfonate monooxygenase SsuD/methylene tetrahydromethanopterin reductase-like flavin-dependent oxidoreductase (luciferase family)
MRLGYFAMPMHPAHRPWAETLDEDREAVILADKLGFYDAFIGEHLTDRVENITNSMLFLSSLIHATSHIKLATGTTNLSQSHPTLIASHAAMFDHMAKGRFILGISPGNLRTDAEALGQLDVDRNQLFAEAIDVILEIWRRDAPYDIDLPGNRFKVSTGKSAAFELDLGILGKPYQQPRPEIVGTVVAPYSKGVILMGQRDFHPLSANFLMAKWARTHWANYAEGKASVGVEPQVADWRIARTIFVADDDAIARAYGGDDSRSPYRFYYRQLKGKFDRVGRTAVFKEHKDQPDSEITEDYVLDNLVIRGSVNSVVDQILALRDITGDFGELVYAGMDWVDERLGRRSMELMATEVMPRVNKAIANFATASTNAAYKVAAAR